MDSDSEDSDLDSDSEDSDSDLDSDSEDPDSNLDSDREDSTTPLPNRVSSCFFPSKCPGSLPNTKLYFHRYLEPW